MAGAAPQSENTHSGSFILRLSLLFCWWQSYWRSQGRVTVAYSSVIQVCPFRIMVSSNWLSHCSWFWSYPPGFAAFLGLELGLETKMLSPGRKGQVRKGYPGGKVLVFPVLPLARHWGLPPWWLSAPAVNCSDTVFSYRSQVPYSTCQGIFPASHNPISQCGLALPHPPATPSFQAWMCPHPL